MNMTKYKLKIVQENGGYVGRAILNDEVEFTTNVHKDPIMASRELSNYVASKQEESSRNIRRTSSATSPSLVAPDMPSMTSAPARRCCGRG